MGIDSKNEEDTCMKRGIVHYGRLAYHQPSKTHSTCKLAISLPDGRTISLWKEILSNMGFDTSLPDPTPKDLFEFVKTAFEEQKKETLHAEFSSKYIASLDGAAPIPSGKASRLYSGGNVVYVDELILSALFEYVAIYYLWAKDFDDKELFSFCFRYTVGLLNYSCRLGILTNDKQEAKLVDQIRNHCDINGVNLLSDLYWSCLAFAYCHELAHIYLKHSELDNQTDALWKTEYEADAVGFDVYLRIIETVYEHSKEPFAGVFHDYLYVAPMILFQFYEDTYFMSYWLFGERAGNSHPPLNERFNALLRISERPKYTFETSEGNDLLNNYVDISECFREQLILKLQRGKLNRAIREGVAFMSQTGYYEAELFQKNMCDALKKDAEKNGWNSEQMIGLWDTAVDIELLDEPSTNPFVWSHKGKTYSTKAFNVRFSLKKVLISVLEYGGTFEIPDSEVKTIFVALLMLYKLVDIATVELSEAYAVAIIKCHKLHAMEHPILEEELLQVPNVTHTIITELDRLGCIELRDGYVRLNEEIYIR